MLREIDLDGGPPRVVEDVHARCGERDKALPVRREDQGVEAQLGGELAAGREALGWVDFIHRVQEVSFPVGEHQRAVGTGGELGDELG